MRKLKVLIAFIFLLGFISCSKQQQTNLEKEVDTATTKVKKELDTLVSSITNGDTIFNNVKITQVDTAKLSSPELRKSINNIFSHYIDIKDELADNDSIDSRSKAKEMMSVVLTSIEEVGPKNIDKKWKFSSEKVEKAAAEIEAAGTLRQQRILFDKLTKSVLEAIQQYGLEDKTIYQLSCSDALSGKGATWLTDSKDSDNPYLGEDAPNNDCAKVVAAWEFN
jgi:hypothetical protein